MAKQLGRPKPELIEDIQKLEKFVTLVNFHGEELRKARVKPFYELRRQVT